MESSFPATIIGIVCLPSWCGSLLVDNRLALSEEWNAALPHPYTDSTEEWNKIRKAGLLFRNKYLTDNGQPIRKVRWGLANGSVGEVAVRRVRWVSYFFPTVFTLPISEESRYLFPAGWQREVFNIPCTNFLEPKSFGASGEHSNHWPTETSNENKRKKNTKIWNLFNFCLET